MQKHETYFYKRKDYDGDGRNKLNPKFLFIDQIRQFEKDFIGKNSKVYPANYLFASPTTIRLIERCFVLEDNETFGMDLINGEIDLDTNLKIEEYSRDDTIYAVGSLMDKSEPLYLIIKDKLPDNKIVLKYIPENDGGEYDFKPVNDRVTKPNTV